MVTTVKHTHQPVGGENDFALYPYLSGGWVPGMSSIPCVTHGASSLQSSDIHSLRAGFGTNRMYMYSYHGSASASFTILGKNTESF